jgi:hypothetical protein
LEHTGDVKSIEFFFSRNKLLAHLEGIPKEVLAFSFDFCMETTQINKNTIKIKVKTREHN